MIGLYVNLFLSILFIIPLIKKNTGYDIYVIWGIYFVSNVLALFFDPSSMSGFKQAASYSDSLFILYGILVCYVLSPLYVIRNRNKRPVLKRYNFGKNEKKIIWFAIIGGLFSIAYMIPYAVKSLYLGAKEVRSVVMVSDDQTVLPQNIFTTIAVAFATFFSIYLGLFFLGIKSNLSKNLKVLLFIISLSYVINSLCYTARDGLLFFVIFAGIYVINYWKSFSQKSKRRIYVVAAIFGGCFIYLLTVFTKDRFEDSSNGTMGYIATQPYVFAENIDKRTAIGTENFYGTSLRFPVVNKVLGLEIEEFDRKKQYEWTFGTFITDFYAVNGLITMIILLVLFTEFFRYHLRRSLTMPMKFTLIYTFYIHFIISGLFYFRLGTFSGNVFMIIIGLSIIFSKK